MILIEIKYNSKDIFELKQFSSKKLYKNNNIIGRVIETIFLFTMLFMSIEYINNSIILGFFVIVILAVHILLWNFYTIYNYVHSKKYSNVHQSMKIIFEEDYFTLKSNNEKRSYCYQYRYCKLKAIYDKKDNLIMMLNNPVEFILIPKRELGIGDYDRLIDYLKSKIDNNFIYKM